MLRSCGREVDARGFCRGAAVLREIVHGITKPFLLDLCENGIHPATVAGLDLRTNQRRCRKPLTPVARVVRKVPVPLWSPWRSRASPDRARALAAPLVCPRHSQATPAVIIAWVCAYVDREKTQSFGCRATCSVRAPPTSSSGCSCFHLHVCRATSRTMPSISTARVHCPYCSC